MCLNKIYGWRGSVAIATNFDNNSAVQFEKIND